ncbi:hypothetical protein ACJIZ3_022949 [Penstemon smallii]|uniref:PWWP domain-containing protein n=1 Tax=Penstemon smallii TaxID=265156 RepID=A0ABD3TPL7_9LAMI
MVEVVGSDVLVDGISGIKGGGVVSASREIGILNDEGWNPGIEAIVVSSSATVESIIEKNEEVVEKISVVDTEERAVENEAIDDDSVEDFVVGEVGSTEEILHSVGNAATQLEISAVVGEDLDTAQVDGIVGKVGLVDAIEVLPVENNQIGSSKDGVLTANPEISNPAEHNQMDSGPISATEIAPELCGGEILTTTDPEIARSMDRSISVPDVAIQTCGEGEILTSGRSKDGVISANVEMVFPNGEDAKVVNEKEILAAESEDLILEQDSKANVQDESKDCVKDGVFSGKAENESPNNGGNGRDENIVDEKEVLTTDYKDLIDRAFSGNAEKEGPNSGDHGGDGQAVDKIEFPAAETKELIHKQDASTDVEEGKQDSIKEVSEAIPESIHEESLAGERGEAMVMDLDEGDTAEVKEDISLEIEMQDGMEDNLPNTKNSISPGADEIVQEDSGVYENQPLTETTMAEVTVDQNIATSHVKALDEDDESSEKVEKFDAQTGIESLEHQETAQSPALDTSSFRENGECSKVETVDVVSAEVRIESLDESEEQEVSVQKTEIPSLGAYEIETINVVPNEVQETEKPELNVFNTNISSLDGFPQSKEHEVSVQEMEVHNLGADEIERINIIPNEVPELTEKPELNVSSTNISSLDGGEISHTWVLDVASSHEEVNKFGEAEENSNKGNDTEDIVEDYTSDTKLMDVEVEIEFDQDFDQGMEIDCNEQELGTEEPIFEEPVKSVSSLRMNQLSYFSAPENEGQFEVSDLVWGKVRSHPWWPGQIFDPEDASEKAVKYHKKDSYLVAYFGDRTFAWNDASLLKPFRSHFSQIEKQSNSEIFQNAVTSALEEVSRRVELGLVCSCIPKDAYKGIETQVVENTGIREESSRRCGVDQSSRAAYFEPEKLLEYIKNLAPCATSGVDRLDLVIARAQLSAFSRFKGYRMPMEFPSSGELLENDADIEQQKHIPKDGLESSNKERCMTEIMEYSPDDDDLSKSSVKKRKALDSLDEVSDKRVHYAAKVSTAMKPSFKIGECIRRVASQLTGSTSVTKGHNDEIGINPSPPESSSLSDMLSQLQLLAQEPKKRHNFLNTIVHFFSGFRSSVAVNKRGRKKKSDKAIAGSGEEFEFDDVNDSYWTDRIVQNYSEEQLLHNSQNGTPNHQLVPFGAEKSAKPGRKPHSRKRYFSGDFPMASVEIDEKVKRRKQESSPAELILNFAERNCVPSEINLNKMFRRFGTLMESETEVDHDSGRAKVIFKRGSDAEVAHDSAEKFKIFGPVLVNYQIGYSPLISVKVLPHAIPQFQEEMQL